MKNSTSIYMEWVCVSVCVCIGTFVHVWCALQREKIWTKLQVEKWPISYPPSEIAEDGLWLITEFVQVVR